MTVPPQHPGAAGAPGAGVPGAGGPAEQGGQPQGIDLSAVRSANRPPQTAQPSPAGPGAAAGGQPASAADGVPVPALVFDVDTAGFNDLIQLSARVPVIVDLWADWCGPCKQLSPVIERVVESMDGAVILAKVDVDANPQIQQAFQVQSIPAVFVVLQGQPIPLFQGAMPEPQVREAMSQVLAAAQQAGVTERAVVAGAAQEPAGPAHPEALAALESGDLAQAEELYRAALAQAPADEEAKLGLARVELLCRLDGADASAAIAAADADPKDVTAALAAADAQLASGDVDGAFSRLLALIPVTAGDERESVRLRLLDHFELVGGDDPRVVKARGRLMRALF